MSYSLYELHLQCTDIIKKLMLHVQIVQKKKKRFCKSRIHMKHHQNRNLKPSITVFSALANMEKKAHTVI